MTGGLGGRRRASGLVLAMLAGWLLAPNPQPPPSLVQPSRDDWQLPVLASSTDTVAAVALVSSAPFWGPPPVASVASAAASTDDRWRVAGVFDDGARRGVLVTFSAPGRPPQRLYATDLLPDGKRIVRVGERHLYVRVGATIHRLGVERIEP